MSKKEERRHLQERLGSSYGRLSKEKRLAKAQNIAHAEAIRNPARERAEQEIASLLKISKGSLANILPVVETRVNDGRYPQIVLDVLTERMKK